MGLLRPIIHCLVDLEPKSFNADDAAGRTVSFAINLSCEFPSDGTVPDIEKDETAARGRFLDFLSAAGDIELHLYRVKESSGTIPLLLKLEHRTALSRVSESAPLGIPTDLHGWLVDNDPKATADGIRYWATVHAPPAPNVPVDVGTASATHRLRAAQAWNAPIGHKFGLTYIVRLPADIRGGWYAVLPCFPDSAGSPALTVLGCAIHGGDDGRPTKDTLFAFDYDALGVGGPLGCHTTIFGEGLTVPVEFPGVNPEGYLLVEPDAENVRRVLTWFEERAASLMGANPALTPELDEERAFEDFFGITEEKGKPPNYPKYFWGHTAWYAAARLVSALDPIVLGLLKPAGALTSEGELLAPLVTALIDAIRAVKIDGKPLLHPSLRDGRRIAETIRGVLLQKSPLLLDKSAAPAAPPATDPARLVNALRHVYGLALRPPAQIDERSILTALLDGYVNPTAEIRKDWVPYAAPLLGRSVQSISSALQEVEQTLYDETGTEAAIVRLFETVETTADGSPPADKERIAALLSRALATMAGDVKLEEALRPAVERAWTEYRLILDGQFNGAEAVRRAAGSTFVAALLGHASANPNPDPIGTPTSQYLKALVAKSAFYEKRFFVEKRQCQAALRLLENLVIPDLSRIDSALTALKKRLRDGFREAVAPLLALNAADGRFIPDGTPQPLAIQIAADIDGSRVDEFAKHFNGIAVAIRRMDFIGDGNRWAHAHLADLEWGPSDAPGLAGGTAPLRALPAALHPMLPAASDGRGAMFIEYQGFPFADPAFDARLADQTAEPRDAKRGRPFYQQEPHAGPDFAAVPRLAYGRAFETFSFVTSNAGTIPLVLQRKDPLSPWMPDPLEKAPKVEPSVVGTAPYRRRTAISQIAIVERLGTGQPGRIGATLPGVTPLAKDYARIALQAEPNAPGLRDIFREPDGAGRMIAGTRNPADEEHRARAEWRIRDLRFSGTPNELTIYFFSLNASGPDHHPIERLTLDPAELPGFPVVGDLTIRIEFVDNAGTWERFLFVSCGTKTERYRLTDEGIIAGWLRLSLKTATGTATLTFADPGSQKPDNVPAPLLLLAPKQGRWKPNLTGEVSAVVSTPRVSYLDFERWFANADRYQETFKTDPKTDSKGARFMRALLQGYVMRHLDPQLAAAIEQLPDPAVGRIRIELTPVDTLLDTDVNPVPGLDYDLAGRLFDFVDKRFKGPGAGGWTPASLRERVFNPLNECFQLRLRVGSGPLKLGSGAIRPEDKPSLPVIDAGVPTGVVARLSMDALVQERHFNPEGGHPEMFDRGLVQYVTRRLPGDYLAFPAAAMRIETMYDDVVLFVPPTKDGKVGNDLAIKLAAGMISAEGVPHVRTFDLMTASAVPAAKEAERKMRTQRWRVLAEIDVMTQRFKPTGRPIYHYVNPREHRKAGGPTDSILHPALWLELRDSALAQFELEAFFDRPDVDAHPLTKTLDPLPARTKLQEHHWESPSATYFRHRFTLRSRYAGALGPRAACEIDAWPSKPATAADGWTMRVAMLAELSPRLVTRPQLRALIPLTTAPGGDDARQPAPPIAAILQEPPFAGAGLADRIACEIKTGFGYGFEQNKDEAEHANPPTTPRVEIRDSRKEAGPRPQLDYRPLDKDAALGLVLRNEGPMGLTFDNVNAPAPAFPNAMLSLRPDTLFGKAASLEDFFAGVSMRRYIDVDWTMSGAEQKPFDGERCWWLTIPQLTPDPKPAERPRALLNYEADQKLATLLGFNRRDQRVEVYASKLAIDGVGGTVEDWVQILCVDEKHFRALAILHQPIAPGHYSMSVFVRTNAAEIERGQVNTPLMLASFEWSPPRAKKANGEEESPPAAVVLTAPDATGYRTMASAPTFLRWTKTGRDFDFVHIPAVKGDAWEAVTMHVRELSGQLDHMTHEFLTFHRRGSDEQVWLRPSTFVNPYPVHLHRYLGLVTSRFLQELGRPTELFCRTSADLDVQHHLVAPNGTTRNANGKIFKPQEQIARVVEFETQAAILCDRDALVPHAYRQAYFDLVATGFKLGSKDVGTLRLYFRFVGSPAHLRGQSKVTLALRSAAADKPGDEIAIDLGNTKDRFAVGLTLMLQRSGDNTTGEWGLLRSDGSLDKSPKALAAGQLFKLEEATNANPGFFVTLKAAVSAGEFWTDVSLLHSQNAFKTTPLDLGWLFSPGTGDEAAASVSADGLNAMVEAQARIVAVSPPIPIIKH